MCMNLTLQEHKKEKKQNQIQGRHLIHVDCLVFWAFASAIAQFNPSFSLTLRSHTLLPSSNKFSFFRFVDRELSRVKKREKRCEWWKLDGKFVFFFVQSNSTNLWTRCLSLRCLCQNVKSKCPPGDSVEWEWERGKQFTDSVCFQTSHKATAGGSLNHFKYHQLHLRTHLVDTHLAMAAIAVDWHGEWWERRQPSQQQFFYLSLRAKDITNHSTFYITHFH